MWIIFDLDDTLIRTSQVTTPFYLREVAKMLSHSTLEEESFFSRLIFYHNQTISSKETLKKFFSEHPGKKKYYEDACSIIYKNFSNEAPVEAYPNVKKNLFYLSSDHTLFLVSKGVRSIQLKKLEKAGIDREVFSKIVVSSKEDKKESYQKIVQISALEKAEILVVGDRPILDLKPAKELGCTTVHIRQGRGKQVTSCFHDFAIDQLDELKSIVNKERGNHGI